jgi:hypothetical protein
MIDINLKINYDLKCLEFVENAPIFLSWDWSIIKASIKQILIILICKISKLKYKFWDW